MEKYTFRQTREEDLQTIMAIIREVQTNFRLAGIDQWQDGYPNEETFRADMQRGESYVLLKENAVVATAMVSFRGEPTYEKIDGAWLTDQAYVVVHRIAVQPSMRGQRLTDCIFKHVSQMCKEKGVTRQRIDTHADNSPMRRVIERHGYSYCGIIYVRGGAPRLAYEKAL